MTTATSVPRASSWRDTLTIAASLEAIAVAVWLLPASVYIVRWGAAGPVRLALLAPAWQLLALTLIAAAVSAALVVSAARSPASGSPFSTAGDNTVAVPPLARVRSMAAPFLVLWLWAIPYVPWLGDRLPLLLVLAGPVRWVLPAVAALAALAATIGPERRRRLITMVDRVNGRAVFAISVTLYLVLGLNSVRTLGLGGDEPHYLIIAESLLKDGDLQIENNHRQGDYRSFYPRELRPDFMQRGQNGAIYSIHPPGLPALLLPVYAVAGYRGAVAMMCVLAALAALAVFLTAEALAGRRAAVLTWLAVCFTVPFVPYSWSIFPEMAGAVVVAWAVVWLWRPPARTVRVWLWRGLVLASLPWMHTKFAVFFATFGAALALRAVWPSALATSWRTVKRTPPLTAPPERRNLMAAAALLTPMAISGALWLYSFAAIYGTPNPEAPYGTYTDTYVLTRYIPHGLIGILFDQKFGLLFYSPVYLLAIAGAWIMVRTREERFVGVTLLITVALFVGSTSRLYMFWGGSSAPARFLVPIVPCLAPLVAVTIARARSGTARALIATWMAIGLGVAAIGVGWPARLILFSDPHGRARLLEMIQAGSPLALVVPTFTEPDWSADLVPLLWWLAAAAVALIVATTAATTMAQRRSGQSGWRIAAVASGTFLMAGAVLTARPAAAVREATARRGALEVVWQFDGTRLRTFDYQAMGRAAPARLQELSTLVFEPSASPGDTGFVAGPVDLPAGAYDAVIWFDSARPRDGDVVVSSSPRATFARLDGTLTNPARLPFELPVSVRRLTVEVPDRQLAQAVSQIQIVPRAVLPPSARPDIRARAIESLPGRERAYVVYLNDEAYPEGGVFWTRGTATAETLVSAAGASRLTLTLSTGPMTGAVTVVAAGESRTVQMTGDEPTTISFSLPPGQPLVPVSIQSSVMFRPGEVDRTSGDMRGLGCHVELVLE
jgi:hypothetical protein